MEYIAGGDMRALFKKTQQFSEETVEFYVAKLALAVVFLYKHSIIHR
jgi:serine/threonine protein kinase